MHHTTLAGRHDISRPSVWSLVAAPSDVELLDNTSNKQTSRKSRSDRCLCNSSLPRTKRVHGWIDKRTDATGDAVLGLLHVIDLLFCVTRATACSYIGRSRGFATNDCYTYPNIMVRVARRTEQERVFLAFRVVGRFHSPVSGFGDYLCVAYI